MKEIIDQYSPILEGVETKDLKEKVKAKQKKIRLEPGHNKTEKPLQSLKTITDSKDDSSTSSS